MINFQFFPRSHGVTPEIQAVIDCFKKIETTLDDGKHRVSNVTEVERRESLLAMPRCSNVTECNDVLALLRPHLDARRCYDPRLSRGKDILGDAICIQPPKTSVEGNPADWVLM